MILPAAYILYKLLKRFPMVIVFIVLSHSCLANTIQEEAQDTVEKEYCVETIEATDVEPDKRNPSITYQITLNNSNRSTINTDNYRGSFSKSLFHDLFLLYQNIKIDSARQIT